LLSEFCTSSGVFSIGEVDNGNVNYVAPYQQYVPGVLSYPLFYVIRRVFGQQQSMQELISAQQQYKNAFVNIDLLGSFVDNHDNSRFLNSQVSPTLYRNALAYILFWRGIPIVYYGSEQGFQGGNDPYNRESLWNSGYNRSNPYYTFIQSAITARKANSLWLDTDPVMVSDVNDTQVFAFARNKAVVVVSNLGDQFSTRTLSGLPFADETKLCDVLNTASADNCVVVHNGQVNITLANGNPQFLVNVTKAHNT
jgi:alpha-amylase